VIGFKGMEHVSAEALKYGLLLSEMKAEQAEKDSVWNVLLAEDPLFVNGFGHGSETAYTGDGETTIFTNTECSILAGRVVYLLSCVTANILGPAIISVGGIAYGGYDISWTWLMYKSDVDPYTDWYAEGYWRASNEFPISLIQGETVARAKERCIAEYDRWIGIWETERSDDPYAASVIKYLIWDRDGLVVLGDESATIIELGMITIMSVDIEPPKYVKEVGESFPFEGRLIAYESGIPLPNRLIELWEVGEPIPIDTTVTDGEGRWIFNVTLARGSHLIHVKSVGDDEYTPTYTSTYRVEVGVITPKVFGNQTRQYTYVNLPANQIRGSWFKCPELGLAHSITVWLEDDVQGRVKFGLYKKADNSLIGVTEEAVNPVAGLLTLYIISGGTLEATDYYIVLWSDSSIRTTCVEVIDKAMLDGEPYDTFPKILSPLIYDHMYRMYCTYQPTPFLPEHQLNINSVPLSGVQVMIDDVYVVNTPKSLSLPEGTHLIEVPEEVVT